MTTEDYLQEHWQKPLLQADATRLEIVAQAKLAFAVAMVEAERAWIRAAGEHFGWTQNES